MPIRNGSPPPPGFPPEAETGKFSIVVRKQREAYSPARPSSSSSSSSSSIRPGTGSSSSMRSSSSHSSSSSKSFLQKLKAKTKTDKTKREESLLRDHSTGYTKVGSGSGGDERKKSGSSYENWSRESPSLEDILRVFSGNALSDEEEEEQERGRQR